MALLPDEPGVYVIILHLAQGRAISVGRLGNHSFSPGYYAYVGSALGPGGLAARIGRHIRTTKRPRWHIDALRRISAPLTVWCSPSQVKWEHVWAAAFEKMPGVHVPIRGFGASDCRCLSHLFLCPRHPSVRTFRKRLQTLCFTGRIIVVTDLRTKVLTNDSESDN